ncbi:MAG: lamin tail domain-containing protein [Candidatus Woesearchaeota archaeon]
MPKLVSAVYISQVLYDPSSSEITGEAIEFYNPLNTDVDISGWVIATETSQRDAVIPANSIIRANGYFLLADEGWNTTNSSWRNADYEEKITMNNDNSGIALKDANGTIIDAVGWGNASGISNNLYEGTPTIDVSEGKVLLRIKDTNNNIEDFIEADPDFSDPNAIRVSVNVSDNSSAGEVSSARIMIDDDSGEEGTQIKPVSGGKKQVKIVVVAPNGATATFLNQTIEFDEVDENTYEGFLLLDSSLAPGKYKIDINDGQEQIEFEYLPLKDFRIKANKISFNAVPGKETITEQAVRIKNTGNVELSFAFESSGLKSGNSSISSDNLKISRDKNNFYELGEGIIIKPGEEANLYFSLFVPKGTKKGSYSSIVSLKVEED